MRLPIALALLLGGCQLIIGEIELPQVERVEAGANDAHLDATPGDAHATPDAAPGTDATVARDTGRPDAAWDFGTPADAAPDVNFFDAASPPFDPSRLTGTWHLYGMHGRQRRISMFVGSLSVSEDGTAIITALGDAAPLSDAATPLGPHPDRPNLLSTNFFPLAGLLIGTLDPIAGVGVLVNDEDRGNTEPAFITLVRQGAVAPTWPERSLYAQLWVSPLGEGELGLLVQQGARFEARNRVRVGASPLALAPQEQSFGNEAHGRVSFSPLADGDGIFAFTPTPGGSGGSGEVAFTGTRIGLAWAGQGGGTLDLARRFFCGGVYFDGNGAFAALRSIAIARPTADVPELSFPDGRLISLRPLEGGLTHLDTQRSFFHQPGGLGALDPSGRILLMIDGDPVGATARWATALCTTLGD